MSVEEWWAAERKAAEFWRKVKENQIARHSRSGPNHDSRATPTLRSGQFGVPMHQQIPKR